MSKIVLQLDKIGKEDIYFGRDTVSTFRKGQPAVITKINASHVPLLNIPKSNIEDVETLLKIGIHTVNNISELLSIDKANYKYIYVLGYHSVGDGGGGLFRYDNTIPVSMHDGGMFIDPNKTFPTSWGDVSQQYNWFQPNTIGSGVWARCCGDEIDVRFFGAKGNGGTNDVLPFKQALYKSGYTIRIPNGSYSISGSYEIELNNDVSVIADSGARIIVNNSFSGNRVFFAVGKNNIRLFGLDFYMTTLPTFSSNLAGIISFSDCNNVAIEKCSFKDGNCALSTFRYIFINSCKNVNVINSIIPQLTISSKYVGDEINNLENVNIGNNIFYIGIKGDVNNGNVIKLNVNDNKLVGSSYNGLTDIRFSTYTTTTGDITFTNNSFNLRAGSTFLISNFINVLFCNNYLNGETFTFSQVGFNNGAKVLFNGNIFDYDTGSMSISFTHNTYSSSYPPIVFVDNILKGYGCVISFNKVKGVIHGNTYNVSVGVINLNRMCILKNNSFYCGSGGSNFISITDDINDNGALDINNNFFYFSSGTTTSVISVNPSTYNLNRMSIIGNIIRTASGVSVTNLVNTSSTVTGGVILRNVCQGVTAVSAGSGTNLYVALNHTGASHEPVGYSSSGYTLGTYTETRTGINSGMNATTANNVICTLLAELKAMGIVK